MKKFVSKFLLFSIPFALVFVWFLAFEPYDYFGIRGGTNYGNKQIYEMRRPLREQPTHIILGTQDWHISMMISYMSIQVKTM